MEDLVWHVQGFASNLQHHPLPQSLPSIGKLLHLVGFCLLKKLSYGYGCHTCPTSAHHVHAQ